MILPIYPDDEWVKRFCKIGQGHACCRYLTITGGAGWSCEKSNPSLRAHLDERVATETITARGDNCPGLSSRSMDVTFEGTLEELLKRK